MSHLSALLSQIKNNDRAYRTSGMSDIYISFTLIAALSSFLLGLTTGIIGYAVEGSEVIAYNLRYLGHSLFIIALYTSLISTIVLLLSDIKEELDRKHPDKKHMTWVKIQCCNGFPTVLRSFVIFTIIAVVNIMLNLVVSLYDLNEGSIGKVAMLSLLPLVVSVSGICLLFVYMFKTVDE